MTERKLSQYRVVNTFTATFNTIQTTEMSQRKKSGFM